MCGRFSLGLPHSQIQALHGHNVQVGEWIDHDHFVPRHNIAPRSYAPVLRRREPGEAGIAQADAMVIQTMKWGLVPHWSKHEDTKLNTVNARGEALTESAQGMWASIKGKRRCAVIAEGYYEWLKKGPERLPHFTKHQDGRLMLLAGLYDNAFLDGQTEPLWTFTIVTTAASPDMEWLHDRQPVILSTMDQLTSWVDVSSQKWTTQLSKILEPYHDQDAPLVCYQVPKEVGKVGTESGTFIEPISERKDGIQAMFARQKEGAKVATPSAKKRKRTVSPQPGSSKAAKTEAGADQKISESTPKIEKIDAWSDNSKVEYLDEKQPVKQEQTPEPTTSQNQAKATKKSPKKSATQKHKDVTRNPSQKITSFFVKK